jgi:hypothetical protein
MITRAERIKLFKFYSRQRAEKAARRWETTNFPAGICMRCNLAFWESITVWVDSREEEDVVHESVREELRRGNPRPNGHELLKEIRARKATRH